MNYHPIELNPCWQKAANKLKAEGYTYQRRENSVVPGTFVMLGRPVVYLVVATLNRREQVWEPVSAASIPTDFNPQFASIHTGMSKAIIKLEIAKCRLPARRTGRRAIAISDADLLQWISERPRRGVVTPTYRTRAALEKCGHAALQSMLRAAVRSRDVDFHQLFEAMARFGVTDPESLMLADIQRFYSKFDGFSRQELILMLEVNCS